jgi:hypothetical protein
MKVSPDFVYFFEFVWSSAAFSPPGQLGCIVVRPEMHEEQPRLRRHHVAVKRCYLNPVITQCLHDRIRFFAKEHEISGDCSFAAAGWKLMAVATPRAGGTVIPFSMIVSARGTPKLQNSTVHLPAAAENIF